MKEPKWISSKAAEIIHFELLERYGGLKGEIHFGGLFSALEAPKLLFHFRLFGISRSQQREILSSLAACYAFHIAKNHPFIDGNKRLAFVIAVVFLKINGWDLTDTLPTAEAFERLVIMKSDYKDLAEWFQHRICP